MTATDYLGLEDQATGANDNTWGDVLDANAAIIEQAIARVTSVATTGGTTILTDSQNRFPIIRITGTLVSNATIQVQTNQKNWTFINATAGDYTVTVKTASGTGKVIPKGRATRLYSDGTNVELARYEGHPVAAGGGTADAITATFQPATTAADLKDGYLWIVEAAGANTVTNPTFNPDGLGAKTIFKGAGSALQAGDIAGAGHKLILCYDESSDRVMLLNPFVAQAATTTEVLTGTATNRAVTPDALAALWEKGSAPTIATNTSIGEGGYFFLSGNGTVETMQFATNKIGRMAWLKINATPLFEHSANLILPGGVDIQAEADDVMLLASDNTGDVYRVLAYFRADGTPLHMPADHPAYTDYNLGDAVAGAVYTQAHGLAALPRWVELFMKCTATDGGYAVDDYVSLSSGSQRDTGSGGQPNVTIAMNTTNVIVSISSGTLTVAHASTFAITSITPTKWDLIARVFE